MFAKLIEAAGKLSGEGKKDPKLLKSLAERLASREPIFNPEGYEDNEDSGCATRTD